MSVAQVKDLDPRNQYTATAGQTIFPYTFPIFDKDDLVVIQEGTTLTEGTDYTVSGVGDEDGGNVTLTTGATVNDTITIYRDIALERLVDYQDSGDFLASDVNDDFDRQIMIDQQLEQRINRCIQFAQDDTASTITLANIATRGGKLLGFDSSSGEMVYSSIAASTDDYLDVPDVATMKALTGLTAGVSVVATKEFSSGNGGGGTYDVISGTGTANGYNIIAHDTLSLSFVLRTEYDQVQANQLGGALDDSTDNTAIVQAAIDLVGATADRGGRIRIPRYMNFNLKSLTFAKRCTLEYFIGDDISAAGITSLNTNELVLFQANANNAGIVNERRFTSSFHPGYVVDVRKDVTGHDSYLGGAQTRTNPARASYNIQDEQLDIWRVVWQNYNTETDFHGVQMHHWVHRITITGITTASFSTVPTKGTIITGTTSGAKGRLYSIDGTNMLLTWITGEFQVGETVSDDDETTTDTIATESRSALTSQQIGWNAQEGQVVIGLPTNMTNEGSALNVGGKVSIQNTRSFGQILPETITSPGVQWVDDWDLASPAGLEVVMDTTVSAGRERLELQKLDTGVSIGHVGAVRAYTNFSNSVASATTDFNIASIVKNSTGDYTITFTEAFARADYTISIANSNIADFTRSFVKTTSSLRIRNYDNTWSLADLAGSVDIICVGGDF